MAEAENLRLGLSRNVLLLILGIGALLVIAISLFHRSGGFSVIIESAGQRFEVDFEKEQIGLSEMLDEILSETNGNDGSNPSKSKTIVSILSAHGFYHIPSVEAASAIRQIKEDDGTQSFVRDIREILYDLKGPFSRPSTFRKAPDARLLSALDDLNDHEPSSPLVAKLWEMSLEWNGIFSPREVPIKIIKDDNLAYGHASTCRGSILLGKSSIITIDEKPFIEINITKHRPCLPTKSIDLLSGEKATVWISPYDLRDLDVSELALSETEAVLIPFPKGMTNNNSAR